MIKLKPIKPKGLAESFRKMPDAVNRGMDDAAEQVKKDLEQTTQGWQHQVVFTIEEHGAERTVTTDDEIWGYVDRGTDPHVIVAHGKALAFTVGGTPKTRPGILVSGPGSKGSAVVVRPMVHHPGTKPRNFSKLMAERWRRAVAPYIRSAIEGALHG